jgi:hypothetical protein
MIHNVKRTPSSVPVEPEVITHTDTVSGVRFIARPDVVAGPEDWPPVWFSFAQHRWTSLVLVPAYDGVSVQAVARALSDAGRTYDDASLRLIEAEGVTPATLQATVAEIRGRSAMNMRTIVSVASPITSNTSVPIIRSCDTAVLIVPLGDTSLASARRTLAVVGRESFLGAITISAV